MSLGHISNTQLHQVVVKHKVTELVKQITIIKVLDIKLQLGNKLKQVNKVLFGFLDMVASRKGVFVFSQDLITEIVKASKSVFL